jgi:hypothetical protein
MTRSLLDCLAAVHNSDRPVSGALAAVSAQQAGYPRVATALSVGLLALLAGEVFLATRLRFSGVGV